MTTRVIVNGCFDILHSGHLRLLRAAKSLGTVCVAVDSDDRIRATKGLDRPINNCFKRVEMLEALRYVDHTVVFHSEDDLCRIIREWKPDFMVKGSDYRGKYIVGEKLVQSVVFIELTNDSTTEIIKRIKESPSNR